MPSSSIKLFIAEDHTLVMQGYQTLLASVEDIAVVANASTYYDIIHKLKVFSPDVLLLDLSMPMTYNSENLRLSGLDILEFIRKEKIPLQTLITSSHRDYEIIHRALGLGARGYVLKNTDFGELTKAIRTVAAGKNYLQKEVEEILLSRRKDENRVITDGIKITPREKEILIFLAEGKKAEEIADDLELGRYTIEEYKKNLMKKFGAKNAAHLIKIACDLEII